MEIPLILATQTSLLLVANSTKVDRKHMVMNFCKIKDFQPKEILKMQL